MNSTDRTGRRSRWYWTGGVLSVFGIAIGTILMVWDWNWFRPLAEARLSAAFSRAVSMERLEVHLGRVTILTAYGVVIANPSGFEGPDFATIPRVSISFEADTWWQSRRIVLPAIELDQPNFNIIRTRNGENNLLSSTGPSTVEVGDIEIRKGTAHVHDVREESDVTFLIATERTGTEGSLIVEGMGTHARQPISFHAIGGTLLALRDATKPYPVNFELTNGETRITLKGHIRDPLALQGADLNLVLSGPNMELLLPLTGIATPKTPPYRISGRLDFGNGQIKLSEIVGKVGSSDLNGEVSVDPRGARPVLSGTLLSHRVDMQDLGGFIGSEPGRTTTPGQSPRQIEQVRRAEADPRLLPTTPISIPKVRAADVHIDYQGEKIIGGKIPFDSVAAKLDIDDGHIRLSPLRLGIGGGAISGTIDLTPDGEQVDADVDVKLDHVNISNLLAAAGLGGGQGTIDGTAKMKGRGGSLSGILAHGNGAFHAVMPMGGNINALLVDLMGVELGRAFFAAIGMPDKEAIRCMVADFVLQRGILVSRAFEVDTTDHIIAGGGRIDVAREAMEMTLRTDPKHFTIGTLATPVVISGYFKDLHFAPTPELAIRSGAAAGLGFLFPPAALLPTIQFGVGENSPCAASKVQTRTR